MVTLVSDVSGSVCMNVFNNKTGKIGVLESFLVRNNDFIHLILRSLGVQAQVS